MRTKIFEVQGCTVVVIENPLSGMLEYYMNEKTLNLYHCASVKGNIDDVTEEDAEHILCYHWDEVSGIEYYLTEEYLKD